MYRTAVGLELDADINLMPMPNRIDHLLQAGVVYTAGLALTRDPAWKAFDFEGKRMPVNNREFGRDIVPLTEKERAEFREDFGYDYKEPKRQKMTDAGPKWTSRKPSKYHKYHTTLGQRHKPTSNRSIASYSDLTTGGLQDKRLQVHRLIAVPWSDTDGVTTVRRSKNVWVKGVLLRWTVRIKPAKTLTSPLVVRWAILNPETNTGEESDISTDDFFRDPTTALDGYIDFPTTGVHNDYITRKINTDKYGILQTGGFHLSPSLGATGAQKHWHDVKMQKIWIPINKDMKWLSNATTANKEFPMANVHLVWWFCDRGDLTAAQNHAAGDVLDQYIEKITYFRNINL